jgi:hypothetical protein
MTMGPAILAGRGGELLARCVAGDYPLPAVVLLIGFVR